MSDQPDEVRPRSGTFNPLSDPDARPIPIRFVPTEDPNVFLAVTIDGERVIVNPGDQMHIDVLGPGQSIRATGPTVTQTFGGDDET